MSDIPVRLATNIYQIHVTIDVSNVYLQIYFTANRFDKFKYTVK